MRRIVVSVLGFFVCLGITITAAGVGGLGSAQSGSFYAELSRPGWAPPGWLFGPVWSVLYLLIAVSLWTVWQKRGFHGTRAAYTLFAVQLILNALWPWLFFVWKNGALAFAGILVLWVAIVLNMLAFWRIRPLAALLMLPYIGWVSFATVLCYSIWRLNPEWL